MTIIIIITEATKEEIGLPEHQLDQKGVPVGRWYTTERWEEGWRLFDDTYPCTNLFEDTHPCPYFVPLTHGAWRVRVEDNLKVLNDQRSGDFIVISNGEGGGFYKYNKPIDEQEQT